MVPRSFKASLRTHLMPGILAGLTTIALAQTPPSVAPVPSGDDHILPTMPAPQGLPVAPQMPPPQDPNATPVPPSGDRPGFSYAPSGNHEGVSVVYPTGGEPVMVATDFLEASLRASTTDEQVLQDVQRFEQLNDRIAEQFAKEFFPDKNAPKIDVPSTKLEGTDRNISVEPDPQAGPYARVKVTDKDGNVISEHSVSAALAQKTLSNPNFDADRKIASLMRADFQLPEQARSRFNDLTAEELLAMAADKPELQNKNFLKMKRVLTEEKARRSAGQSTDTQAQSRPRPSIMAKNNERRSREKADSARSSAPERTRERAAAPATSRQTTSGFELPEIVGIILGLGAIGVFIYGFIKTRRG